MTALEQPTEWNICMFNYNSEMFEAEYFVRAPSVDLLRSKYILFINLYFWIKTTINPLDFLANTVGQLKKKNTR